MATRNLTQAVCLVLCLSVLQGCAVAVIGAGAGVAKIANDRRTLGTQLDDNTLAGRVNGTLRDDETLKNQANINVHVFNGVLLLTGQAPSEPMKEQAYRLASGIANIKRIHNQVRVATPVAASTSTHDVWLASKIRASLLTDERIDGLQISVTVEDSEVFLMGLVRRDEADVAVEVARNISGVSRVVKAFEYL